MLFSSFYMSQGQRKSEIMLSDHMLIPDRTYKNIMWLIATLSLYKFSLYFYGTRSDKEAGLFTEVGSADR